MANSSETRAITFKSCLSLYPLSACKHMLPQLGSLTRLRWNTIVVLTDSDLGCGKHQFYFAYVAPSTYSIYI